MINFSRVTKKYDGRPIIADISLSINRGAFVALVGQSGVGKTTLLKAINRLVDIDEGTITVDGQDVASLALTILRRRIGYAFQGVGLFPHMTVAANIALIPRLQGTSPAERARRVAELLALVALPDALADSYPSQLSGGQAQRVGFARALAAAPSIMLLDEPFGALDPVVRIDLGKAYRELHDKMGLTSVLVTHDMAEALLLADRVIVLGDGRILADLPPAGLMAYRGDKTVRALVDAVRDQAHRLETLATTRR